VRGVLDAYRVDVTVWARARCSRHVLQSVFDVFNKEVEAKDAQEQEVVAQEAKGKGTRGLLRFV
jgi:hypothetical protein